jgi:hypothetical protein
MLGVCLSLSTFAVSTTTPLHEARVWGAIHRDQIARGFGARHHRNQERSIQ